MNNDYMERARKAIDEKTLYPYAIAMTVVPLKTDRLTARYLNLRSSLFDTVLWNYLHENYGRKFRSDYTKEQLKEAEDVALAALEDTDMHDLFEPIVNKLEERLHELDPKNY